MYMSERYEQSIRYWAGFCDHLRQQDSELYPLGAMKSDYKHYRDFQTGIPNFAIRAGQRIKEGLDAQLVIKGDDAITYYNALMEEQEEIHKECGEQLSWYGVKKEKQIVFRNLDMTPKDEFDWQNQYEWLSDKFDILIKVFIPRIERLTGWEYRD